MNETTQKKQSPLTTILLLVAVVGIFVVMQYGPRWRVGLENYWPAQVSQEKIQQGEKLLLLDVRTPAEFKAGHVPNSINIPMQNLQAELDNNPQAFKQRYQDYTILNICRSDSRATTTAHWLQAEGFDVKVLSGGMVAWQRAALPVEK